MNALSLLAKSLQTPDKWLTTRKTRSYGVTLTGLLVALFFTTLSPDAHAQSMLCRDDVQIGIGPWCKATLSANQFVTNPSGSGYNLQIVGTDFNAELPFDIEASDVEVNLAYPYIITRNGQTCDNGTLTFHDYVGPLCGTFDAEIYTLCTDSDIEGNFTGPKFTDCSGEVIESFVDEITEGCNLGFRYGKRVVKIIKRYWTGRDIHGNLSQGDCVQTLYVLSPEISDIIVQSQVEIECDKTVNMLDAIDPDDLGPEFLPHILVDGQMQPIVAICKYAVSHSDSDPILYSGNKYKVIRSWSVTNWCTYETKSFLQTILFVDTKDPVLNAPDEIILEANIFSDDPYKLCEAIDNLPLASATDECTENEEIEITIFIPHLNQQIENGGLLPGGLPFGDNEVIYTATDLCGRSTSKTIPVKVVDTTKPIAICTPEKNIGITQGSTTSVDADFFENGSTDNCCLDRFEVRRADAPNGDLAFDHHVDFYCGDGVVAVIFRAYDCAGNFNDCTLQVTVQDLIRPTITAPENTEDDCTEVELVDLSDINILQERYGVPTPEDNCPGVIFKELIPEISEEECEGKIITRSFHAIDAQGNLSHDTVEQVVTINGISKFTVIFQNSLELDCSEDIPLTNPIIENLGCGDLFTRYQDVIYNQDEGACYKLIRTWEVLDWCKFQIDQTNQSDQLVENPDVGGFPHVVEDGYIKFIQEIRITDSEAPVISGVPDDIIVELNKDCQGEAIIPSVVVTDNNCDGSATVIATINDLPVQIGTSITGNQGDIITVKYIAVDGCNNYSEPVYINIEFKDLIKPTPVCLNLSTEIGSGGEVVIWAIDFESSSYDNCGLSDEVLINRVFDTNKDGDYVDDVMLTPPFGQTSVKFECGDEGNQVVQYWIKDNAGNWEFCLTGIYISDADDDDCGGTTATVTGSIQTEEGENIEQVEVQIDNPSMPSIFTGFDGIFNFFGLQPSTEYNITPKKDIGDDNGISTYDMVLMQRHILGVSELNSPYKILAADVNNSGGISTGDMVEVRKLILGVSTELTKTDSWKFVPADYVFDDPSNPMLGEVPNSISIRDNSQADFIGFKMGDLNLNADASNLLGDEDLLPTWVTIENQSFEAGDLITIPVMLDESMDLYGFGLKLKYDPDALTLASVESAHLPGFGEAMYYDNSEGGLNIVWSDAYASSIEKEGVVINLQFYAHTSNELKYTLYGNETSTSTAVVGVGADLEERMIFTRVVDFADELNVYQNQPNPFSDQTMIRIDLPESERVVLDVVDISGKQVYRLDHTLPQGENQIILNGTDLPESGVYYYRVQTDNITETKKLIYIKR